LNVIEQRYGKSIDKEIAMGAQNGSTSIPSTALQIVWIQKSKGYQIIATTP
jgi:tRNA (guanosine-2'-O-)-methyltransferase